MGPASTVSTRMRTIRSFYQTDTGRGNIRNNQSATKLAELGPRMTLQLVKVMGSRVKSCIMCLCLKPNRRRRSDARLNVSNADLFRKNVKQARGGEAKAEAKRRTKERSSLKLRSVI